jgi:hypothetical protein
MVNSELNRSQEYRILVNVKLKNPPIEETIFSFKIMKEKLQETLTNWDSLSEEDKTARFKSTPNNLFIEMFNRHLGRVDYPPDERDDRPSATQLKIKDEEPDEPRDILLKFDHRYREDGNFAYLISPVIDIKDFNHICEQKLLPSKIFQISGVFTIIRQYLPPDRRDWITDGLNAI